MIVFVQIPEVGVGSMGKRVTSSYESPYESDVSTENEYWLLCKTSNPPQQAPSPNFGIIICCNPILTFKSLSNFIITSLIFPDKNCVS